MNDDFEKRLRALRLAAPSENLDRRMDAMFGATSHGLRPSWRANRRWWLVALPAAGAAAALGLLMLRASAPRDLLSVRPLVYQIEPRGLMRELLLTPPAHLQAQPSAKLTVTVHL